MKRLTSTVRMMGDTPVRVTYQRRLFRRRLFAIEFWTRRPDAPGYAYTIIRGDD